MNLLLSSFLLLVNGAQQRVELKVPPPVGLANLGNTCFLNAVLQSLYAHPLFRQTLFDCPAVQADQLEIEVKRDHSQALVNSLKAVFSRLSVANPQEAVSIGPDLMKELRAMEAIRADSGEEGNLRGFDAQEIYAMILGRLPLHLRELFRFSKMETSEQGDRLDRVMSVPLAFHPERNWIVDPVGRRLAIGKSNLEAILTDSRIKTLPPILLVNLVRVQATISRRRQLIQMNKEPIDFAPAFEMQGADAARLGGAVRYQLLAVIVHTGEYHYMAYVRRNLNWYCVNDSAVKMVSLDTVLAQRNRWVSLMYDRTGFNPHHLYLDVPLYDAAKLLEDGYEELRTQASSSSSKQKKRSITEVSTPLIRTSSKRRF